jgi:hypothetical protein
LNKPDATFYPTNDAGAWADPADDAVEKSDAGTGVTTTVLMIVVVDVPEAESTAEVVSVAESAGYTVAVAVTVCFLRGFGQRLLF